MYQSTLLVTLSIVYGQRKGLSRIIWTTTFAGHFRCKSMGFLCFVFRIKRRLFICVIQIMSILLEIRSINFQRYPWDIQNIQRIFTGIQKVLGGSFSIFDGIQKVCFHYPGSMKHAKNINYVAQKRQRNEEEKNVKPWAVQKGKDHEKHNEILEIHSRSKLLEIGLSAKCSKYFSADRCTSALCFLDQLIPTFLITEKR